MGMRPSSSLPGSLLLLLTLLAPLAAHAESAPVDERAQLRAQLKQHRAEQLARLQAYADAGQFPVNPNVAPSTHLSAMPVATTAPSPTWCTTTARTRSSPTS